MTGTGKSTFVRRLPGKPVQIGHGLKSRKRVVAGGLSMKIIGVEEVPCQLGPYSLTLVDTPGFDDTTRSDAKVLQVGPVDGTVVCRGHVLSGVIYLYHITDIRMANTCEFLVDGGRYHDDLKKVAEFVTQLVDKSPVAMMIQRELVEKGRKDLDQIRAEADHKISSMQSEHSRELAYLRQNTEDLREQERAKANTSDIALHGKRQDTSVYTMWSNLPIKVFVDSPVINQICLWTILNMIR
ncbi:hypothetical protein V8E54_013969 [Elaphomyces granulatus]